MLSIANVTFNIVKLRITGHFELKQNMIRVLHANGQFMGLYKNTRGRFDLLG